MVKVVFEEGKNRSAAYDGEIEIGESTYSKSENIWIIEYTYVDENYRGQNIASRLVSEIVKNARDNNVKIIPLCPFAKKEFDRKEEYQGVLAK